MPIPLPTLLFANITLFYMSQGRKEFLSNQETIPNEFEAGHEIRQFGAVGLKVELEHHGTWKWKRELNLSRSLLYADDFTMTQTTHCPLN